MALAFVTPRCDHAVAHLGVMPGTFNPPTRAHVALASAALPHCDEVLFVLPRTLPHKDYSGVGFADRLRLMAGAIAPHPRFAVAIADGGLYLEIGRECRDAYGPQTEIAFLCGRDAAERIVEWKYERPEMLTEIFDEFSLLVARRQGEYEAPDHLAHRIRCLDIEHGWDSVSATEVRQRILAGQPWRHLVPPIIADDVEQLYGRR